MGGRGCPPFKIIIMKEYRMPRDRFIPRPEEMDYYLDTYGYNFSKKACEEAVRYLFKKNDKDEPEKIEPWSKEEVEKLLKKYDVTLERNEFYNHVYVLNKAIADYWGSSLPDEKLLALHVKDEIDDVDDAPGNIFRRWIITMKGNGFSIDWEKIL